VCARWRATLARLEEGAEGVATELDWAIKLVLFRRHCERRGFAWDELPAWSAAAARLGLSLQPRARASEDLVPDRPARGTSTPASSPSASPRRDFPKEEVKRFVATARELFEIDMRFGQLGERGIFTALDRARLLGHHVDGVGDVEGAMTTPPPAGRAKVRGAAIGELAGRRGCVSADWQSVRDLTGRRWLDLSDPFAEEVSWQPEALPPIQQRLLAGAEGRPAPRESLVRARIAALLGRER